MGLLFGGDCCILDAEKLGGVTVEENLKAYDGKGPYIFISYAHDDKKANTIIRKLLRRGYCVWYDEGISGGENWRAVVAEKNEGCTVFVPLLSQNYLNSPECQDEFADAKNMKKTIVPIYLEEVKLTPAMRMGLSRAQALMPNKTSNEKEFWNFIDDCKLIQNCKEGAASVSTFFRLKEKLLHLVQEDMPWKSLLTLAVLLVLAVLSLWRVPASEPETPTEIPPVTTQESAPAETTAPVISAPQTLSGNVLMEIPDSESELESMADLPAFGTSATRAQIGSIWIHDTLGVIPEDAVDVSLNRDGSVMAWTVKDGDLYQLIIAGDGGVDAPPDASHLFRDMPNLTQIHFLDSFFTANTEHMSSMFYRCEKLYILDVTGFNTEKVKSFHMMFGRCQNLDKLDLSSFDTSSAVYMGYMFYKCSQIWKLDLRHFRTENVTNMKMMFHGCESLLSLDISSFDTGNVKNMTCMFYDCKGLTDLDVSHFDTANVTDMSHMFHGCENLMQLNISGFNTANVADFSYMFSDCTKLTRLDVAGFDTMHATDMSYMFCNCPNLEELDVSSFKTYNVTDMSYMFYNDPKLKDLDFSGFYTNKVTNYERFMLENQKINNMHWSGLFADAAQ